MNIIGLDGLVFGVENVDIGANELLGFGLARADAPQGYFETLDGTGVLLRQESDPSLPPALASGSKLRQTIYGVRDRASLEAIRRELSRDRAVSCDAAGALHTADDDGFALRFQVTVRRSVALPSGDVIVYTSVPPPADGLSPAEPPDRPLTLSHVVYFVPEAERSVEFYVRRLGFVCTDWIPGVGGLVRPAAAFAPDTLWLIQMPGTRWASSVLHFKAPARAG